MVYTPKEWGSYEWDPAKSLEQNTAGAEAANALIKSEDLQKIENALGVPGSLFKDIYFSSDPENPLPPPDINPDEDPDGMIYRIVVDGNFLSLLVFSKKETDPDDYAYTHLVNDPSIPLYVYVTGLTDPVILTEIFAYPSRFGLYHDSEMAMIDVSSNFVDYRGGGYTLEDLIEGDPEIPFSLIRKQWSVSQGYVRLSMAIQAIGYVPEREDPYEIARFIKTADGSFPLRDALSDYISTTFEPPYSNDAQNSIGYGISPRAAAVIEPQLTPTGEVWVKIKGDGLAHGHSYGFSISIPYGIVWN